MGSILLLACLAQSSAMDQASVATVEEAIVREVAARMGVTAADVTVTLTERAVEHASIVTVSPTAGARVGGLIRFTLHPATGPAFSVTAKVSVEANHLVATRALLRDQPIADADLSDARGPVVGVLLQPLPTRAEALAAQPRRTIAAGEVIAGIALARPYAVRAGDEVSLAVRSGRIEVRGVARAVSSGHLGDIVRVMPPGSRVPSRARIVGPAEVEMVK